MERPDDVVGRVIAGDDNGKSAIVLQYYYFWTTGNTPDGGVYSFETYKNDYEEVFIYNDTSNMTEPIGLY